jgi:predicted ATPase
VIFSPENSALRTLQREGQIEPLGINGEGVHRLLSVHLKEHSDDRVSRIKKGLGVLGWFDDFRLNEEENAYGLEVCDRFLKKGNNFVEATSANEGFLFILFYLLLFTSNLTPRFFAVDNIDASLNPKLCERLIRELVNIAKTSGKQVILTTHNPSILDGLNLDDDEQRLFVVSRGSSGTTRIKRVKKPHGDSSPPRRLSEMFLRGVLGGLPKNF